MYILNRAPSMLTPSVFWAINEGIQNDQSASRSRCCSVVTAISPAVATQSLTLDHKIFRHQFKSPSWQNLVSASRHAIPFFQTGIRRYEAQELENPDVAAYQNKPAEFGMSPRQNARVFNNALSMEGDKRARSSNDSPGEKPDEPKSTQNAC
jgi:hypothetical protein